MVFWAELCLGFEGVVAFFFIIIIFLNFILYSSGTLKILGGIPLQTHIRSAKILLYLKQTSGESESLKFQSHMIV